MFLIGSGALAARAATRKKRNDGTGNVKADELEDEEEESESDEEDDDEEEEDEEEDEEKGAKEHDNNAGKSADAKNDQEGDVSPKKVKKKSLYRRVLELWKSLTKKKPPAAEMIKQGEVDNKPVHPVDYWYNVEYHRDKSPWAQFYLEKFVKYVRIISLSEDFSNLVLFTIIIAGINVGCQTYPTLQNMAFFNNLDLIILAIFITECVTKIVNEGLRPDFYWIGPEWKWNNFDFAIIVLSLPMWGDLFGNGSIAALRLARLARLGKLIRKIPALQIIVKGLVGGLASIGYIFLLLCLVFYLYAVVGFYLYSTGDPFHFGDLSSALLSMFRISLLENWSDIMYVNIFGCDMYVNIYVLDADRTPDNAKFWCDAPSTHYYDAPLFFISFVVISALVMLSLFVGAVTMSMEESMQELETEAKENRRKEVMAKNLARLQSVKAMGMSSKSLNSGSGKNESDKSRGSPPSEKNSKDTGSPNADQLAFRSKSESKRENMEIGDGYAEINGNDEDAEKAEDPGYEGQSFIGPFLSKLWADAFSYVKISDESAAEEARLVKEKMTECLQLAMGEMSPEELQKAKDDKNSAELQAMPVLSVFLRFGDLCHFLGHHSYFQAFVTLLILIAGFNVGAQTDPRVLREKSIVNVLNVLEVIVLAGFTAEVVLKLLGEKLRPSQYFKDHWNKFDFAIVLVSYIPAVGSIVTVLRLLRLLRLLKLIKRLPQLAVIINALILGLGSIGYVGVILFLAFYVFAILGMMLFGVNDPWHFGSLHFSLITLFRAATLDNTIELLYIQMFGCDVFTDIYSSFPEQCTNPAPMGIIAVIYFVVFIVLAAQVLLTLFIGVISTSMEEARESQLREQKMEADLEQESMDRGFLPSQIDAFREVFAMLDLDHSGLIDADEIRVSLGAMDMDMSDGELDTIMEDLDPNGDGLNLVGFIRFMCKTSKYKDLAASNKALILWRRKEAIKQRKIPPVYIRFYRQLFPPKPRSIEEQIAAAIVIQTGYRTKIQWRKDRELRIAANALKRAAKVQGNAPELSGAAEVEKSSVIIDNEKSGVLSIGSKS